MAIRLLRRGMLASFALGEVDRRPGGNPCAISFAGSAGLIARRKVGRAQLCSLRPEPLAEANRWLRQWEKFWTIRLDRLAAMIGAEKTQSSR